MEGSQPRSRTLERLKKKLLRKKESNGTTTLDSGSTDRNSRSRSPISTSTVASAATASETNHDLTAEPIHPRNVPQSAENAAAQNLISPADQVSTCITENAKTSLSKAPIWTETLSRFEADNKDDYDLLALIHREMAGSVTGTSQPIDFVTPITLNKPERKVQHAFATRLKAYLPSLAASKAILTTFARLDPHQLAPYIVAGLFFAIEVSVIVFFKTVAQKGYGARQGIIRVPM